MHRLAPEQAVLEGQGGQDKPKVFCFDCDGSMRAKLDDSNADEAAGGLVVHCVLAAGHFTDSVLCEDSR